MVRVFDAEPPVDTTGLTEETTMRTSLVIAGSLSAGALAFALAVPVVAAPTTGPAAGTCTGDGPVASSTMARGAGNGTGMQYRDGSGGAGQQHATATTRRDRGTEKARGTGQARAGTQARGTGQGRNGTTQQAPSGTLTTAQRTALAAMAEEEKMAHDVYVTLAARYPELDAVHPDLVVREPAPHCAAHADDALRHRRPDAR